MARNNPVFNFPGEKLNVAWDSRLCIHIGECGRSEDEEAAGFTAD